MNDRVIERGSEGWPRLLDEIGPAKPPGPLYVRGMDLQDVPLIAIVGSRRPTVAGLDATKMLATGLSQAGFGIVSGLAAGIDAAAHQAALDADGYTVGVLGFGLDVTYPRRNARLKTRIEQQGTLISEYPAGTQPHAFHFPQRNRIIAGLAVATLVVEGGYKSGALITARCALDANRMVFAVPGSFRNVMSAGSNELIRTSQAALVTSVDHIFEELAPDMAFDGPPALGLDRPEVEIDEVDARVLALLDDVPLHPDRICSELGSPLGRTALSLSRLEVRGFAARRGARYQITTAGARARAAIAAREAPASSG